MQENKNTILIVDDEAEIRKMLNIFLETAGYSVVESKSGKEALRTTASVKPNLVILDLGLPDMDGKEVISQLREWTQIPVVVLTVRSAEEEVVAALNIGADDYITKPFGVDTLLARINANLRKTHTREPGEPELVNGPLRMDLMRHEVFIGNQKVVFTPKEYALLHYFLANLGRMLTQRQLLKEVWGSEHIDDAQYLRVYIGQIRKKLEEVHGLRDLIVSEPGVGYRMESARDPSDQETKVA